MNRKLLFAAFLLTIALTIVAARHQLTNASPNVAPPPKHAPPLEQVAALASGEPTWQVVAGGGGIAGDLRDVSMASATEGWAVGRGPGPTSYGDIMHYTNTAWSRTSIPTGTYRIDAVSMISSTEGWAVGVMNCSSYACDQGLLMHYTASTGWQTTTLPARPDGNHWSWFRGIDIKGTTGWIVGFNQYLLQFDGAGWTPITLSTRINSPGVSVVDANEAWAVGSTLTPTLGHFSSGSWSWSVVTPTIDAPSNSHSRLQGVHMLNASNGWAVGYFEIGASRPYSYQCLMLHYDGADWSRVDCPSDASGAELYSVRARNSDDVWAVGEDRSSASRGVILHYDGSAWTRVAVPPGTGRLRSVRVVGTDDGWAVGYSILRLVSGNWTRVQGGSTLTVGPVDSVGANEAWFGGNAGRLYQWKDGVVLTYTSPLTTPVRALDMVSPTLGWAATDSPAPHVLRYSEGTWATWPFSSRVNAISMISPDEGWFALADAPRGLMHYSNGVWEQQPVPGGNSVGSVSMLDSSNGWATGRYPPVSAWKQIYTYTRGAWSTVSPTLNITSDGGDLKVIAINPGEAWVAGWSQQCTPAGCPELSELHHFSGGAWTKVSTPDWWFFQDISKVSATEWWAAGRRTSGESAFLHYKDGTYTTVSSAGEDVNGVSMLPNGFGFARGGGSLLKVIYNFTGFFHASSTGNPPTLYLDATAPTATTAKYRDSAGVKFSGGNLWKDIGTWSVNPTLVGGRLASPSDLHTWVGLKNSDDQGTKFDLRAELYKNGELVASGETWCIEGVTRNPGLAKEVAVSFGSFSPTDYNSTSDVLSVKVLTRIGTNGAGGFCGGHSNAVGLRLYFDAVSRPSKFGAVFEP